MKILRREKKLRRGDVFVDEPTGSAPQVNLDGRTEHRLAGEVSKIRSQ